jgi:hypothetical protein
VAGMLKFLCLPSYFYELEYLPSSKETAVKGKGTDQDKAHLSNVYTDVKEKCALGPFLSILVIECQHKCFCANLCKVVDKVQIMSKGMFLD